MDPAEVTNRLRFLLGGAADPLPDNGTAVAMPIEMVKDGEAADKSKAGKKGEGGGTKKGGGGGAKKGAAVGKQKSNIKGAAAAVKAVGGVKKKK